MGTAPYCDIRDLARISSYAVEHLKEANGKQFLGIAGHGSSQGTLNILREAYPERRDNVQEGSLGQGYDADYSLQKGGVQFDASRTALTIRLKYIDYEGVFWRGPRP